MSLGTGLRSLIRVGLNANAFFGSLFLFTALGLALAFALLLVALARTDLATFLGTAFLLVVDKV
jgi:hypothetical protein